MDPRLRGDDRWVLSLSLTKTQHNSSLANSISDLPPLSLYIHIPWCERKCPYCDFNSHVPQNQSLPEKAYVEALIRDLDHDLSWVQGRSLHSIFIGGGTPSLFSAEAINQLLQSIEQRIPFESAIEISMEANPGSAEQSRFAGYRAAGVNRLSIGVQSFNDQQLQRLGRIHNSSQAIAALHAARNAGFQRVNLDLMYGLPEQQLDEALADLEQAFELEPDHLSWYQLTLEPNTAFYSAPPLLPEDDQLWNIQQAGQQRIADAGFSQYEISAYARPEQQARHNLNYWTFGDYLGIGAGAHGKITLLDEQQVIRSRKTRLPVHYLEGGARHIEMVETDALPGEFMMNVLRLNAGVDTELFQLRTGLPLSTIESELEKARNLGLMDMDRLQATDKGLQFLNNLLALFI